MKTDNSADHKRLARIKQKVKVFTVGSLFTGLGGIDIGLEKTGRFKVVWQSEINHFCSKILKLQYPEVPNIGNIRAIIRRNRLAACCPKVDVICGGFPCQPVSVAGKRRGADDDRYLWPEMFTVIRYCQPEWVVVENVHGFVSHGGGVLLERTCADLEREGYEVAPPIVFPACSLQARHQRDRVWVVARKRRDKDRNRNNKYGSHPNAEEIGQREGRQGKSVADLKRESGEAWGESGSEGNNERVIAYRSSQQTDKSESGPLSSGTGRQARQSGNSKRSSALVTDHDSARRQEKRTVQFGSTGEFNREAAERSAALRDWFPVWAAEPGVDCVVHGFSPKLVEDELAALGNAVVPVCAELIGRLILASMDA
jgi:DNA (cytosine-5)-methyltransferase 1